VSVIGDTRASPIASREATVGLVKREKVPPRGLSLLDDTTEHRTAPQAPRGSMHVHQHSRVQRPVPCWAHATAAVCALRAWAYPLAYVPRRDEASEATQRHMFHPGDGVVAPLPRRRRAGRKALRYTSCGTLTL
jgi:hypothetical protein